MGRARQALAAGGVPWAGVCRCGTPYLGGLGAFLLGAFLFGGGVGDGGFVEEAEQVGTEANTEHFEVGLGGVADGVLDCFVQVVGEGCPEQVHEALRAVRVAVSCADAGLDDVVTCIHQGDDGGVLVGADFGGFTFQKVPEVLSPAVEVCEVVVIVVFSVGVRGGSRTWLFPFEDKGAG